MKNPFAALARRDDKGMSTAEYAVGTLGACSIGGILTTVAQSDWFASVVQQVFSRIPDLLPF